MRKIVSSVILLCLCGMATAQTFTFECFGGFLTTADANCDICNTQVQSRLFSGLLVRKNGVVSNWIDCPYIVRAQGNNLVFQEIIPNPQSVTISLAGTGFSTLQGFKDSTACMCARQDSSWAAQVLSAGDGATATDKTVLLSGGGGAVVFREGTNVTLSRTVDTITINATSGGSTFYQTWKDDGTPLTQRPNANFLQSSDVNLILADDAGNTETEVSADILPNAVDYAEIQQVSANRLLGNPTGSPANVAEIPLATGLFFSGGNLNVADRDSLNEAWTIDADDADSEVISNQVVKFEGAGINVTDYVPGTNTLIITGTEVDGSVTNEAWTIDADAGDTEVISNQTVLIAGGGIVSTTYNAAANTLTVTGTEVDGSTTNELQTIANTSNATSHTATLSNSGGSVQLVEGTGIALATTGTALDGVVTITNSAPDQTVTITGGGINVVTGTYPNFTVTGTEVDGSITNEGSLSVGAGGANTSTIVSNTSASTPVTVSGSNTILVTESGSTITIQGDTSLLATVNDINAAKNRDDSTFVKLSGAYTNKRITDNVLRYGTTGFRTTDTTGIVNIKNVSSTKSGIRVEGATSSGITAMKFHPTGYTNLSTFGSFNQNGRVFSGVNSPYSTRPNYVFNLGYNYADNSTREVSTEAALGLGFETYYQNAALDGGSTGFTEFHIRMTDTLGQENRFISAVNPWDGKRNKSQLTFLSGSLSYQDGEGSEVWQHTPMLNLFEFSDTTTLRFDEQFGFGLQVYNGTNYSNLFGFNGVNQLEIGRQNTDGVRITPPTMIGGSATPVSKLDVEGNLSVGTSYSGTTAAPTNGAIIQGDVGIGNNAPTQPLHVTGNARVTGAIYDSNNDPGTSGQILSSTVTGTDWVASPSAGVTGSGASPQVAVWSGTSSLTGDADFTWASDNLNVTGTSTHQVGGSFSVSQNRININGTLTSTANSLTHRVLYAQPTFANDGTTTNQFYTTAGFSAVSAGSTAATQVLGINAIATNSSPNVSQLYGISGRVDENSASGNLSSRYGIDLLVVKGAQDGADAHSLTGLRARLQESTSTGRILTGVGASIGVENSVTGTGVSLTVSNAKGTNATQYGMVVTNTATGSGVTVANAYGIRFIPTETSSGSITNNYCLFNNTTPVATNSWFLYNSQDYRNYLNGNLAIGVDAVTSKLFVRGTGATSSTSAMTIEKSDGTDYFFARDDGRIGIGNSAPAREFHNTGETRLGDLVTDTPTRIVGADTDGDLDTVGIGAEAELHLTNGTLGTNFHTTISPAELTAGMTNNWNPTGLSTAWIIRLSGDDGFELITGITAPAFNKRLILHNVGANAVLLPTDNQSSSAANRFSFGRDVVLFPGKSVEIQYDVTSARWRLISTGDIYDNVQHVYMNQVFTAPTSGITSDYDFWQIVSGGSVSGVSPVAGRWSGIGVSTGSSSTGLGHVSSKDLYFENNNASGTATWAYLKAVVKTPSSLSDGSNDYTIRVGFNAIAGGGGTTDGMYFNYNHGLSSGQWACHTTNGGNTQSNASGITVATSTTYVLEVVYRTNLSVEFFINGARVATNDTFIPTNDDMICMAEIQKSVGTTSREIQVFTMQTSLALVK